MLSPINQTKTIALYTVENQTNETVETVHGNLLLPLSTVIDWRRPFDPNTLVKPVYDDNDANEVELDHTAILIVYGVMTIESRA